MDTLITVTLSFNLINIKKCTVALSFNLINTNIQQNGYANGKRLYFLESGQKWFGHASPTVTK